MLLLSLLFFRVGATTTECLEKERVVHAFYYLWYGCPEHDGRWIHWNHDILPHWNERVRRQYRAFENKTFHPPRELHSRFYPERGPYSSRDPALLRSHFATMREAGIDAAVLSWTGRSVVSDTQGVSTDDVFPLALEAAHDVGLGIAIHLEPYQGRSPQSVRSDLEYLVDRYGHRLAKICGRPVVYVYDAYHSPDWTSLLGDSSPTSVRGTPYDIFALATFLESPRDENLVEQFDGFYTYFATDGFTFGSTRRNWQRLLEYGEEKKLAVSLSVGPGYDDTKIRPWNAAATRDREHGDYFRNSLNDARRAPLISITSFNEWGEGTQIEPAREYGSLYIDILKDFLKTTTTTTENEEL